MSAKARARLRPVEQLVGSAPKASASENPVVGFFWLLVAAVTLITLLAFVAAVAGFGSRVVELAWELGRSVL